MKLRIFVLEMILRVVDAALKSELSIEPHYEMLVVLHPGHANSRRDERGFRCWSTEEHGFHFEKV